MNKALVTDPMIIDLVTKLTDDFAGQGRILLRPSGTEPLIRVMVEAYDPARLDAAIDRLVTALKDLNDA